MQHKKRRLHVAGQSGKHRDAPSVPPTGASSRPGVANEEHAVAHHYACASTHSTAYAFWNGTDIYRERGVAEANQTDGGTWWISRVLVKPESMRGQGIGTKMLELLKQEVKRQGCQVLQVAPGGYDSDPRVFTFYKKNGFVETKESGLLEIHIPR